VRVVKIEDQESLVLKQPCSPVEEVTPELRRLAACMVLALPRLKAVGLAAPQVGHPIRLIAVGGANVGAPFALFNPVILERHGQVAAIEGCLSAPGLTRSVTRNERVIVSGLDRRGKFDAHRSRRDARAGSPARDRSHRRDPHHRQMMDETPVITIDLDKKCIRCRRGGATQSGFCLKCITKNLKEGKYDHVIRRLKTRSVRNDT
jgi:peptide deformylase